MSRYIASAGQAIHNEPAFAWPRAAQTRTSAEPSTLNASATTTPTTACGGAPLVPLPVPELPVLPEPDAPLVEAGAEGVKTADGFARHELAAAFASCTDEGAFLLIVAFPSKSHEDARRFVAS